MAKAEYPPPAHLSERSRVLWASVVPSRAKSLARQTLVLTALEALDRADAARDELAIVGMTSTTARTGAVHVHPLVKVEREARQQFVTIWQRLLLHRDF